MRFIPQFVVTTLALMLAACGGGGGDSPADAPSTTAGSVVDTTSVTTPVTTPVTTSATVAASAATESSAAAIAITRLDLAQSHIVPAAGKTWPQPGGKTLEFHLAGGRAALALVDTAPAGIVNARLEGRIGSQPLGSVALQDNTALPLTEDNGERWSSSARVAQLPAEWLRPGLELRVAATHGNSAWQAVNVGADTTLTIKTLPFYLFGANDRQVSLASASAPAQASLDELQAKLPVGQFRLGAHPAQRVDWPQLVIGPRNGGSAYVMSAYEQRRDPLDPLSAVHAVLSRLRAANGESALASQYFGALMQLRSDGTLISTGGGLGLDDVATGDHGYTSTFLQEQGRAFGLPKAGESYTLGTGYPYVGGSLAGSAWGYDAVRRRFHGTWVPSSALNFKKCATQTFGGTARQMDAQGRCVRQDPMQGGAGDQAMGDAYTIFSDYSAARIQRALEGEATLNADGSLAFDGGRVVESSVAATGYRRWNSLSRTWVAVDPTLDPSQGAYGVNAGFPVQKNLPVYSLVVTRSQADTPGATRVYAPIGPFTGNLLRNFDPTSAADRAAMAADTGTYPGYCRATGCDFTLRVSYADGRVRHVVLQGGFRSWYAGVDAPLPAAAANPNDAASFRSWAVNVPADGALARIELLATPKAWLGLPATPAVLASYTVN